MKCRYDFLVFVFLSALQRYLWSRGKKIAYKSFSYMFFLFFVDLPMNLGFLLTATIQHFHDTISCELNKPVYPDITLNVQFIYL